MSINDEIRRRLRKLAADRNITYRAWSEEAGLGPNSVSQFLNGGESRSVTVDTLAALAACAGVPVSSLIIESDRRLDVGLLAAILELTFATHPDPKANPGLTAKAAAATYLTALDHGIGAKDRKRLAFAIDALTRESSL